LDLVKIRPTAFPVVLLAPSWGYYDFTKVFNLEFLSSLLSDEYHLVFRPHPLVLMRESEYINQLKKQSSISIDTDLCGNYNLEQASVLITDYSGISMEFMALHKKPVIFLSTQEKIINTQFQKYDIVPMEHLVRNMSPNIIVNHTDVNKLKKTVLETLSNSERHPADNIDQFVFNQGSAGSTATKFVMEILKSE
jgi:CDP-glycerol glycerophosphotransferase (TagB/SpsB family)